MKLNEHRQNMAFKGYSGLVWALVDKIFDLHSKWA